MLKVNTEEGKIEELVASGTPNEICGDIALIINEIWKGIAKPAREFFKSRITELLVHPDTPMWDGTGPAVIQEDESKDMPNHEMLVYEAFLEKEGDAGAMNVLADAMGELSATAALCTINYLQSGCVNFFELGEIKEEFRRKLGAVQVACTLVSVAIGGTAEEECKAIDELEKQLQKSEE